MAFKLSLGRCWCTVIVGDECVSQKDFGARDLVWISQRCWLFSGVQILCVVALPLHPNQLHFYAKQPSMALLC